MKKDLQRLQDHGDGLGEVIEQIKELCGGITKMIAIHEEKHAQHDKDFERNQQTLFNVETAYRHDIEVLERKVDETKDQLHKRIGQLDKDLGTKLDEMTAQLAAINNVQWFQKGGVGVLIWLVATGIAVIPLIVLLTS